MSKPEYMPTPEQIAEACRKIREGWTARDWELRPVRKVRPLETRIVRTPKVPK